METITKPVNPFGEYISDEDKSWGWEQCREAMDEYYREALQALIVLLMSAEGKMTKSQLIVLIMNAKEQIGEMVNKKEG